MLKKKVIYRFRHTQIFLYEDENIKKRNWEKILPPCAYRKIKRPGTDSRQTYNCYNTSTNDEKKGQIENNIVDILQSKKRKKIRMNY